MILPPELIDEVLIHLRHDKKTLRNCSLVAKSWTYPSQKYLYTRIRVAPSTYQKWRGIASPTSVELLRHVHSLSCHKFLSLHVLQRDYLKSFHGLQNLTLEQVHNVGLDTVESFLAFQNTLSSLSLFHVCFTLDAFIKLLGYFPNVRELRLYNPTFDTEHLTTPPPNSKPPRGALHLSLSSARDTDILLRGLCALELEYDELDIYENPGASASPVHPAIFACGKTLAHLNLCLRDCKFQTLHNSITSVA
jgi:hypothetical protein